MSITKFTKLASLSSLAVAGSFLLAINAQADVCSAPAGSLSRSQLMSVLNGDCLTPPAKNRSARSIPKSEAAPNNSGGISAGIGAAAENNSSASGNNGLINVGVGSEAATGNTGGINADVGGSGTGAGSNNSGGVSVGVGGRDGVGVSAGSDGIGASIGGSRIGN